MKTKKENKNITEKTLDSYYFETYQKKVHWTLVLYIYLICALQMGIAQCWLRVFWPSVTSLTRYLEIDRELSFPWLCIDPQIKCDFHLPKKEKQKKPLQSVTSYSRVTLANGSTISYVTGETSSFVLIASATTHDNSHASELLPGSLLSLLLSSCRAKVNLLFFFFSFTFLSLVTFSVRAAKWTRLHCAQSFLLTK